MNQTTQHNKMLLQASTSRDAFYLMISAFILLICLSFIYCFLFKPIIILPPVCCMGVNLYSSCRYIRHQVPLLQNSHIHVLLIIAVSFYELAGSSLNQHCTVAVPAAKLLTGSFRKEWRFVVFFPSHKLEFSTTPCVKDSDLKTRSLTAAAFGRLELIDNRREKNHFPGGMAGVRFYQKQKISFIMFMQSMFISLGWRVTRI